MHEGDDDDDDDNDDDHDHDNDDHDDEGGDDDTKVHLGQNRPKLAKISYAHDAKVTRTRARGLSFSAFHQN